MHILTGEQFADRKKLDELFSQIQILQDQDAANATIKACVNKIVATLFFENSTRTRLSFESAAIKLGANVLSTPNANAISSTSKGESLEDTIKVVSGYCDVIVIRHPENLAAQRAAKVSPVPIINAGDGYNEHPTQALIDLYTIKKELGQIDNLKIAFLADFRYQRNIHSLVPLFKLFESIKLYFIAPPELRMPKEYKDILDKDKVNYTEIADIKDIISELDVLYVTRVFKERFSSEEEYERLKKTLHIDMDVVSKMKQKSAILHVMPRIYEIDKKVDDDPRAAYFRQTKNGLYVRMALLKYVLVS
jgi:aspartate carbamoyltransferase catalytic subunit